MFHSSHGKKVNVAARRNSLFSQEQDIQLLRWCSHLAKAQKKSLAQLNPSKLSLYNSHAMTYGKLAGVGNEALRMRFAVLALFNKFVFRCSLPFVLVGIASRRGVVWCGVCGCVWLMVVPHCCHGAWCVEVACCPTHLCSSSA